MLYDPGRPRTFHRTTRPGARPTFSARLLLAKPGIAPFRPAPGRSADTDGQRNHGLDAAAVEPLCAPRRPTSSLNVSGSVPGSGRLPRRAR